MLTLRVTVTIADLAAFVRDPTHTGQLDGEISFGRGERPAVANGILHLFAPAEARAGPTAAKVMYYGLRFQRDGREQFVAGLKHVDGYSPFRLWTETTTLYTQLHDGTDERAAVAGAGVLRVRPIDLLRTLPTLQATPRTGAVNGARTLAHFGLFFAGELWNSYIARRPAVGPRGANARRI
jgi:hypothetical protein